MADIVEGDVVVGAPEKRHRVEALAPAQHVQGCDLTLTFGNDPMLDANIGTGAPVGPARNISGGKDARHTRLEVFVHENAAIDGEAGLRRQIERWTHANTEDEEIRLDGRSVAQRNLVSIDTIHRAAEVKLDAVRLVHLLYKSADLRTEHALERHAIRSNDVHFDLARAQGGGNFQPNETRPNDYHALGGRGSSDDRSAVGEGAQIKHLRGRGAGNLQMHWIGASGDQQGSVPNRRAIGQLNAFPGGVDRTDTRIECEFDATLCVVFGRPQRYPVFGGRASQVIFREVGAIAGWIVVRTDEFHGTCVTLTPKPVCGGQPCRSTTDDHDRSRAGCGRG